MIRRQIEIHLQRAGLQDSSRICVSLLSVRAREEVIEARPRTGSGSGKAASRRRTPKKNGRPPTNGLKFAAEDGCGAKKPQGFAQGETLRYINHKLKANYERLAWSGGWGRGFRVGLRGHLEDEFAGAGEAHAVAGNFFDGGRVSLELVDFLLQILIFFVELFDLGLHFAHFGFGTVHGHEAVRAEDVLQHEKAKSESEKVAGVAA